MQYVEADWDDYDPICQHASQYADGPRPLPALVIFSADELARYERALIDATAAHYKRRTPDYRTPIVKRAREAIEPPDSAT